MCKAFLLDRNVSGVIMKLDEYVKFNRLFDVYGALLTDRQREVVELYIFNDLSLFEIAERLNISRQAASDAISSARTRLSEYEAKLKFIEKTDSLKKQLEALNSRIESEDIGKQELEAEIARLVSIL